MTDTLTKDCLYELANETDGPCLSVFMPTHNARQPDPGDALRLRRLLRRARRHLTRCLPNRVDILSQLEAIEILVRDRKFWKQQSMGLAIFIAAHRCCWFRVPIALREAEVIAPNFQLKPLLPLLAESARCFVLTFSKSQARLLECTSEIATEFEIAGPLPDGEAAWCQSEFLERIALRLAAFTRRGRTPIVLAGDALLVRLFRIVAESLNVLPESIVTSPNGLPTNELHERGLAILHSRADAIRSQAAQLFVERVNRGGASECIEEILPAAFLGSVEALFLVSGTQRWGKYDMSDWTVHQHAEPVDGDQDLIDLAAVMTYLHDGSVFVAGKEEIPGNGDIAAVFRQ